jgi:hypothetical protein
MCLTPNKSHTFGAETWQCPPHFLGSASTYSTAPIESYSPSQCPVTRKYPYADPRVFDLASLVHVQLFQRYLEVIAYNRQWIDFETLTKYQQSTVTYPIFNTKPNLTYPIQYRDEVC